MMFAAMAVPFALAAEDTAARTITVTNSNNDTVSIDGKTFKAYKLFDVTYADTNSDDKNDAFSYTISSDNYFMIATTKIDDVTAKSIIEQYFTLTQAAGTTSPVIYNVKPIGDFTEKKAYELSEKLLPYLTAATPAKSVEASGTTATIAIGNGPAYDGYYLVTGEGQSTDANHSTVTAAVALTTTQPTAAIKAKLDAPHIDKKIDEGTTAGSYDDNDKVADTHAIGDTVPYVIHSNVPEMTGYEKYFFIVTDRLSGGLTYDPAKADLSIKIGNSSSSPSLKTLTTDEYEVWYSLNGDDETPTWSKTVPTTETTAVANNDKYGEGEQIWVKIVFVNFIQYKGTLNADEKTYENSREGQDITITYNAILNDAAKVDDDPNDNDAKLEYSTKPDVVPKGENEPDDDDDNVTGKTPWSNTKTYVSGFEIFKIGNNDEDKKLADVEFTVTGTELNDIKETIYSRYVSDSTVADADAWYRLTDGTYTQDKPTDLTKDKFQGGMDSPKYRLETGVAFSKTATDTVEYSIKTDSNGIAKMTGLKPGTYTIKEVKTNDGYNLPQNPFILIISDEYNTDGTFKQFTATLDGVACSKTATGGFTSDELFDVKINNETGVELPSTGGIGTTIFYVAGSIMVLAAAILLITKRRMGAED